MAGKRGPDGSILYSDPIYIDTRVNVGSSLVEGSCTGYTHQSGAFRLSLRATDAHYPYFRLWIIAAGQTDITIGAITLDFCDASSTWIFEHSSPCPPSVRGCSDDFSFAYNHATGSMSMTGSQGFSISPSRRAFWADTVLVVPNDLTLLGQSYTMTWGVTARGSGGESCTPAGSITCLAESSWQAGLQSLNAYGIYSTEQPTEEFNQSSVTFYPIPLGQTALVQGQFRVEVRTRTGCIVFDPHTGSQICSYASSWAEFETTIQGITSVELSSTKTPVPFKAYSCSGTLW